MVVLTLGSVREMAHSKGIFWSIQSGNFPLEKLSGNLGKFEKFPGSFRKTSLPFANPHKGPVVDNTLVDLWQRGNMASVMHGADKAGPNTASNHRVDDRGQVTGFSVFTLRLQVDPVCPINQGEHTDRSP